MLTRTIKTWALTAAVAATVGISGCGGSPEVGDAVVSPPGAPTPSDKPAETPADAVAPDAKAGDAPKTAPAAEPEAAKPE